MMAYAETKSSRSSLNNRNSPQYKAVEWLAQDKVDSVLNWGGYELLQRYVLRVLYHSTGGENWNNNAAAGTWFQSDVRVCSWRVYFNNQDDLTCGTASLVDQLILWGDNLQGTIPSELGLLTALTWLSMSRNQLSGTIPTELTQLTNMEELYLYGNNLIGTVPSGFCAAPFPDWRTDGQAGNKLYADCMSEIQCDCCDACYDESDVKYCWNGAVHSQNTC